MATMMPPTSDTQDAEPSAEIGASVTRGDCLAVMAEMAEDSVDAIVTDPPYGLGFMGKAWDALPPGEEWARACLRVLKPGGHMLAFGGTRTWHRLATAIEDADFELRDSIAWLYGSGFPKSHNLDGGWQGWGTALKPAFEPIVVARKPLIGTVLRNVTEHGTGALNVAGCRVGNDAIEVHRRTETTVDASSMSGRSTGSTGTGEFRQGRWPANVLLDESQASALDEQTGVTHSRIGKPRGAAAGGWGMTATGAEYDDAGGASRFFYVAKASSKERPNVDGVKHPTVKPLALMRWLVRLVTPPGGVVLDPFAGSGTTLEAALIEGFTPLGIELADEYLPLIQARLARAAENESDLFGGAA